jgi:lysophospholipase L1-like esterase
MRESLTVEESTGRSVARRVPQLALMLVSLAFSLAAGELVLRLVGSDRSSYYVWPPNFRATLSPSPELMPGIEGESRFTVNDQGLRGDRLDPHASGILALGGSTTECLYLDDQETWPYLLQRRLNAHRGGGDQVWVGNAGRSGHTSHHHLAHAERLLELSPAIDTVLVLSGANDLLQRLQLDRGYRPQGPADPDARRRLLDRAFAVWPGFTADDPFWKRSEIWRRARLVKNRYLDAAPAGLIQDRTGSIYAQWRANRRAASGFRTVLPDLSPAIDDYVSNLRGIIDQAKARQVRVILMTQPAVWRAGLPPEEEALLWMGGTGAYQETAGREYYSPEALAEGLRGFNQAMLGTCAATQVECIDLEPRLAKDRRVFYDDMHFTEAGARAVADTIAEYLERSSRLAAQ